MGTIAYNTAAANLSYIYRATGGGVTFSANLTATAAFDYFTDTAVVDDAIYFGHTTFWSDLDLNVGTALSGTDVVLVWEYYNGSAWVTMTDLTDNTVGFTATGAHTVVFPWQINMSTVTVNSITNCVFIRCRIVSLTAITEGGANQTTAGKYHNGLIAVTDYTDETPCTFTDIYNWMTANHPECNVTKTENIFRFPQCGFLFESRVFTSKEVIMCGSGQLDTVAPTYRLYYVTSGYRYGDIGVDGSVFIYNGGSTSASAMPGSSTTKCYGTTFMALTGSYLGVRDGEYVNCLFDFINGNYQLDAGTYVGCVFRGANVLSLPIAGSFTNCSFYSTGQIAYAYNNDFTIRNPTWNAAYWFYMYQTYKDMVINLVNPSPAPADNGSISTVVRIPSLSYGNFAKCWFYDDKDETYTDYTTALSNATTGDVPISGEVGDILYCSQAATVRNYIPALEVTCSNASNDYVYAVECYQSSAWRTAAILADGAINFTQNGEVWLKNVDYAAFTSTTINGVAGSWIRLRILTKGTGTPTLSKMRWKDAAGSSDWRINEQYTVDVNVIDEAGNAIEAATVNIYDSTGALFATAATDAAGVITTQDVTVGYYALSPLDYTAGDGYIKKTTTNPITVKIYKDGYETYTHTDPLVEKTALTIKLRHSLSQGRDEMAVAFK